MMRILFISRINLLAGRTNVYNLAKTCEALNAQQDFNTTLVTTDQNRDRNVFFRKMGIHKPFDVICLKVTDTLSDYNGKIWYEIPAFLWVNLYLAWFMLRRTGQFDAVYFRDETLSPTTWWAKIILRKNIFFEIHSILESWPRQALNKFAVKTARGVVAISAGLKHYYQKLNKNVLISLCSAAEDSWFDYSRDKNAFRKELGLPIDKFLIGYTGVVGANPNNDYYEVDDVVRSLVFLPANISCVIVGELNGNAEWLREVARDSGVQGRVIIVPWQERSEIPKYLQAFDSILIPRRKKNLIGDSPAKMFPALAARRPIIAGCAECIEEVLTDNVDAIIVEENNPDGWTRAIMKIYEDQELAEKLSKQALITNSKHTWNKRGIAIAEFIKKTMED